MRRRLAPLRVVVRSFVRSFVRSSVQVLVLCAAALLVLASAAHAEPGWGWPLPGERTVDRPFAPPSSEWGAGHRGVDLRGQAGELVLSAGPGTVTYAGLLAGRGVVTVSHHGGVRTTYEPVTATVVVGQVVQTGTPLGTLATGHDSCRPGEVCLHWGLLRGDTYLDPLSLVRAGQLRLLPTGGGAVTEPSPAVHGPRPTHAGSATSPGPTPGGTRQTALAMLGALTVTSAGAYAVRRR